MNYDRLKYDWMDDIYCDGFDLESFETYYGDYETVF